MLGRTGRTKWLAGSAHEVCLLDAGYSRNRRHHHARKKLHGSHVALIEGSGGRGQNFENAQCAAIVTQRRNQNGANSQAAAAREIDSRVAFGVMAKHDLAGANGFGGDACVGLKANAEIGSGAAGASAANNLISGAQGNRGPGRFR